MPRFEKTSDSAHRFWDIELDGLAVTIVYGRVGGKVQRKTTHFPYRHRAEQDYGRRVRAKLTKGYLEVRRPPQPPPPATTAEAREPAFEQALAADPDDEARWAVYADWLHARGDPRGELANVQLQLAGPALDPQRAEELRGRESALFSEHPSLFPEKLRKQLVGQSARPVSNPTRPHSSHILSSWAETQVEVRWKAGFIEALRIGRGDYHPFKVVELLSDTLAHPSSRFLRSLAIGICDDVENEYGRIPEIIARHSLPTLRRLRVTDIDRRDGALRWISLDDMTGMWRAAPNLEEIAIHAGYLTVGTVDLPQARALTLWTLSMETDSLTAVVGGRWPSLEKLELTFGTAEGEAECDVALLGPLFDGDNFPVLSHLGLIGAEFANDIASALPAAKMAAQIDALDLSLSVLGSQGAAALVAGRERFAKLRQLNVSECFLSDGDVQAIMAAYPFADVSGQRSRPTVAIMGY